MSKPVRTRHEQIRLPLSWQWIERVRITVSELLSDLPEHILDAAQIASSELAENVVKYGEPVSGDEFGQVLIEVVDDFVRIRSVSGASRERAEHVLEHVALISGGTPSALYTDRLRFLMENPTSTASQLGLLRIAFEGQFALSASYDAPRLTVSAERRIE